MVASAALSQPMGRELESYNQGSEVSKCQYQANMAI